MYKYFTSVFSLKNKNNTKLKRKRKVTQKKGWNRFFITDYCPPGRLELQRKGKGRGFGDRPHLIVLHQLAGWSGLLAKSFQAFFTREFSIWGRLYYFFNHICLYISMNLAEMYITKPSCCWNIWMVNTEKWLQTLATFLELNLEQNKVNLSLLESVSVSFRSTVRYSTLRFWKDLGNNRCIHS